MWRRLGFVRTDISEEHTASIIRVKETANSEMSILIRGIRDHIPEKDVLHSHRGEHLKFHIQLTGCAL
jgi:hypothetical protein